MGIRAESLLMAAGLVGDPDRTARIAARTLLKDLKKSIVAIFDHDEPRKLAVLNVSGSYIDRLAKPPPYEEWMESLEDHLGLGEAGAYQVLHENARRYLMDRYPGSEVTGIVGAVACPPNEIALTRWRFLCDNIENQRFVNDLHSAATLRMNVDAVRELFPESYEVLVEALRGEMARRNESANGRWRPNWWQDAVIRRFMGAPDKPAPPAPKPPETPRDSKYKINVDKLEPVPGLT